MPRLVRLLGYTGIGVASYSAHQKLTHLEKKYPGLPHSAGSQALHTARPNNHCAYVDIYAAQIPLLALQARNESMKEASKVSLENAWARSIFSSRILRAEGLLIGLFTLNFSPCYTGDAGFGPDENGARVLLNGGLQVQREAGAEEDSNGLLVSMRLPDGPRVFFERIAQWGYPWRLMSCVRHEMSVSEPWEENGEKVVEVRFASAHDYEIVEDDGEQQKIIPAWVLRLHRGLARYVLDSTVEEVKQFERIRV
ncbi:unnamed protein product [Penicillium salamii]|uniref:Uncharacterized protein n=1 Tax=Penicillium salamii TaxID=1612424 RepID=A0A9W4IEM0_9EURO|nr:unnamed protein product [Penicillium salamii]CAG8246789.1 unnamed protein product [Penicillium salamii]CAG8269748.1 unnamed protein product [Penicillium salamii]CAG8422995.1 unnamed protein product [Penicillium salamii]